MTFEKGSGDFWQPVGKTENPFRLKLIVTQGASVHNSIKLHDMARKFVSKCLNFPNSIIDQKTLINANQVTNSYTKTINNPTFITFENQVIIYDRRDLHVNLKRE